MVAAVNGNTKELGKQLDAGRSVDARDLQNGRTLLICATLGGHDDAVDLFLRRSANPHPQDLRNRTALLHAVANGHEAITGRLITAGAKLDAIDDAGYTALILATSSVSSNLVERLLMLGANVDTREWRHGKNLLLYAAEHGFETCVELLLNADAEVDFVDKSGRTSLPWAAGHGHAKISIKNEQIAAIEILKEISPPELGYGLMPRPVPANSPLLEEIQQRYKAVEPDFDWRKTSGGDLLLWALDYVNVKKGDGTSVLCQACWSGYGKVVSLLIEKGVDPNGADKDGRTPLASAAEAGHKEIVQKLLEHDVDIDPVDKEEMTSMLAAAYCGHREIVLMLLEKGTNPNAHNIDSKNALSFASGSSDLGFVPRSTMATHNTPNPNSWLQTEKAQSMNLISPAVASNTQQCDGQIPKCQNCGKSGRECLVEDPATGLFRPRDYMQSLETRVAYLEGLLQQARPDVALDHLMGLEKDSSSFSPSAATPFVGPPEPESVGNGQRDVSAEAEDARDQLSTDVALLCLTTASKEPHYFGPSSAVSFSRIISTAINLPKRSQASTIRFEHGGFLDWNCPQPFAVSFPSPPLGTALSQAYFGNIHAQYPFLHEPTFRFWEEQCFKADLSGNLSAAGDMAQFFVWMVYATASLALGPAHYDTAEAYYKMALKHQPIILELDSIESIQSLLSCAVYSIRSPAGGSLWKSSGLAIRYCIQLGYHRSVSRFRRNANPLIAEMSKRCFWVAYDIDRVASFILGRPVGIPDDCIDAELPFDIDDDKINALGLSQNPRVSLDEPPTNMTGAIHVIKLRRLWSKIGNTIYPAMTQSPVNQEVTKKPLMDQLRAELEAWHSEIPYAPDTTGLDPLSVFASREWFRLAYDHSILILYRHWITHKALPGEEDSVEEALECCMQKAKELCLLYRRLFQYQSLQFTWGSLHILFLGGLTYLYCIWKSAKVRRATKRMDIINTCMACNTALVIIAERWSRAVPYRDIFEVLSERTISLVCGDGSLSRGANGASHASDRNQSIGPQAVEDWALEIGADDIPVDSEWFVQELLQGMSNNEA
ncbi:transcription activator acu-15 [Fusarium agapanthi]|uniref:Transcription activator acu-15 n=1 Tax=Fusarium agapanthi TaxID=1803897 RepID=A0A9P5EEC4_9HYPO|nr:transcription activator acu-15 [Fusarium agapanthi]